MGLAQPSYDEADRERLFDAIWDDDVAVVRSMIDKRGFPIFWYKVRSGHFTALHLAMSRSWGALEVLLDHPNADPELRCDTGRKDWQRSSTPLHSAVEHDYYEAVKLLLDHGADPDTESAAGHTSLHVAVLFASPLIVHTLLEAGANPKAERDYKGRTPLHDTVLETQDEYVLLTLLEDADTDPNVKDDDGRTALSHAREVGVARLVELLQDHGGQ